MKKRNATALSEILYTDMTNVGGYTEDFQQYLFRRVLGLTSGVVFGLETTIASSGAISVASGSMIGSTFSYGELEGASGVTVSIPVGSRTDTVSVKYLEVADTLGASYLITDIESRTQTTENIYRRLLGSVVVEVNEGIASGALTGGRIPIASIDVTSAGVQSVTDLRSIVTISNTTSLGGDVTGAGSANTVVKLQGRSVYNTAPSAGQSLCWDDGNSRWAPSGANAGAILGYTVSGTPSSGQSVVFNGTGFTFSTIGGGVATGALSLSNATPATPTAAGTGGVASDASRSDHAHPSNLSSSTPSAVSGTASAGSATDGSKSDHKHYSPYDIAGGCIGRPAASGMMLNFVSTQAWSVPASGVGCYLKAQTAATSSTVFTMYKNGSSFGTATVAGAGTSATFSGFSLTTFAAGDVLTIKAPASQDTTIADIAVTIKGVLS